MCECGTKSASGNQIEHLRKLRGWSQAEMADRCNATQQQISNIESGRRKLTWEWMQRIAIVLQCHPMELVYWDSEHHTKLDTNNVMT